ncbi:MAG TPA: DUF6498-containing protein [Gammaproteobacteria bacterium]
MERARKVVTPLHAGDAMPHMGADSSVWLLVAANVFALFAALHFDWTARSLMLVYWSQSVAIGFSYFLRILSLEKFSTENFYINKQPVQPTQGTKVQVAFFFAFHYGFFHFIYLMFLVVDVRNGPPELDIWFWLCAAAFFLNHFWSYRYNRDIDRMGTPNIGTLMFTPYLRIVPMHLTIIAGGLMTESGGALLLFGVLKTLADVGMHVAEHAQLRKTRTADGGAAARPN